MATKGITEMSDETQRPDGTPKSKIYQGAWLGLIVGGGSVVGRLASDAVREQLGWWGSMGVGTVAALAFALLTARILVAFYGNTNRYNSMDSIFWKLQWGASIVDVGAQFSRLRGFSKVELLRPLTTEKDWKLQRRMWDRIKACSKPGRPSW